MFGPVAVGLAADAAGVEPLWVVVVVGVILVHVVDHKVAKYADACGVRSIHQRLKLLRRTQAWVHAAWFHRPVAVVGRHFVHAVSRKARTVCGGVEGRQPERVHAHVGEGSRLDVGGHAGEIATHPIGPLGRFRQGRRVVAGVAVDETVGHQHVDQRIVPDEVRALPAPEGQQEVVRHRAVHGRSFEVQGVLSVRHASEVERPRPRRRVPHGSTQSGRRARRPRARGASMPQHGQHVVFDGGAEHWVRHVRDASDGVLRHTTIPGVGVGVVHRPHVVDDELVAVHPWCQRHLQRPLVGSSFDERRAGHPTVPFAVHADVARVAVPFEDVGLSALTDDVGTVGLCRL